MHKHAFMCVHTAICNYSGGYSKYNSALLGSIEL